MLEYLKDWRLFLGVFLVVIFIVWLFCSGKDDTTRNTDLRTILNDVIPDPRDLTFDGSGVIRPEKRPEVARQEPVLVPREQPNAWPDVLRESYSSNGEWECAKALKDIFPNHFFKKCRPNWLKNPETGRNLELDFINEELRLAIEYNGIQHYVFPNCFHHTKDKFIGQVRRDQFKRKRCDEMSVYLITVPYTVPFCDIPEYIYSKLPQDLVG